MTRIPRGVRNREKHSRQRTFRFKELETGNIWDVPATSRGQAWTKLVGMYDDSLNEGRQSHEEKYEASLDEVKHGFRSI